MSISIKAEGYIEKAAKLQEGEVEFVVSTGDLDSQGERINVDGINLKDFQKNPVVLWGHDGFNLPIARAEKIWKENGKLMARAKFYLKDDFPRKVYNYIVDGYLKAVSIGGMVDEWASDGITIAKLTMKEFSVVPIGSNPKALMANKSFTAEQQSEFTGLARAYARKCLSMGDSEINKQINVLESLVTTLKEVALSEPHEAQVDEPKRLKVVLRTAQAVDNQAETIIRSIKLKGDKS